MNDIAPLLRAIARHGLDDLTDAPPLSSQGQLGDDAWSALLAACLGHRLIGHLYATVASGALPVTAAQRSEATAWDLRALAHRQRLDAALVGVVRTLTHEGIDHRVLKGSALARLAYPDPDARHHHDNDVLAPPDRFEDAIAALCDAGFRRRSPPPRPGYDGRFAKSVTLLGQDGTELDLHRTLISGPYGVMLDLPALWETHAAVIVDGESLRCFPPGEQLLHACTTAALSDVPPRWSALRDVAQLLQTGALEVEQFVALARRHRLEAVVSEGITSTTDALGLDPSRPFARWAMAYESSPNDRRRLRVYRDRRSFAYQSIELVRALPHLRDRLAFAHAALLPTREFLDAYDTTRLGWLRRGNRALHGAHSTGTPQRSGSPSTPMA